ncbi:Isochorismatase hydrolase [Hypoxylon crocopeplum]|nr:Isochorismatase hydrolase [Hypoxylon crocopeplum]
MTDHAATFDESEIFASGHYGPSQTALLLLDFHTMFVHKAGGPKALAALEVAAQMRAWANLQGIQVVHCLIDIDATPFPTCKDAGKLAGTVASVKSAGGEEHARLREDGGDNITFTRQPGHVSALKSPGLNDFLQKRGVKSLVLAGLSTSGCVMRTAFAASDAEYVVTVISDGCADLMDDVHNMLVGKVLGQRNYVSSASEFQEEFEKINRGGK